MPIVPFFEKEYRYRSGETATIPHGIENHSLRQSGIRTCGENVGLPHHCSRNEYECFIDSRSPRFIVSSAFD